MTEKEEVVGTPFDKNLQAHLGRQLRRLFNETAAEPVPDRFVDLLERLDNEAPRPPHPQQARAQEAI
jgi:hypothetical protein